MFKNILDKLYITQLLLWLFGLSKKIVLPGFGKLPLYDVGSFFFTGIRKNSLNVRATSISYKFFLALFPAIIFFFTLIPYIPIDNFHAKLLAIIESALPQSTYEVTRSTIEDIIIHQRKGLLSLGFVLALYFSTNGVFGIISAFNSSVHLTETRSKFQQRLISVLLVLLISALLIVAISLITIGEFAIKYLVHQELIQGRFMAFLLLSSRWIIMFSLVFIIISLIYYLAPAKQERFRFFSAGSMLATLLAILSSYGFNYYIIHFSAYNALYGSIGTLIILMVWIQFNAMILLIGFELNVSISSAKTSRSHVERIRELQKSLKNIK